MSRKSRILIGCFLVLFLLIVAVGGVIFLIKFPKKSVTPKTTKATINNPNAPFNSPSNLKSNVIDYAAGQLPTKPSETQVFYTDSGFNPPILTVPKGAIVTFFNMSKVKTLIVSGIGNGNSPELIYGQNIGFSATSSGSFLVKNNNDPGKSVTIKVN